MIFPGGLLPSPHMRLLLTGASGFVGSTVLAHALDHTDWHIVCPVTYRHHGDGARINAVLDTRPTQRHRVDVIPHDLALPVTPLLADRIGPVDNRKSTRLNSSHVKISYAVFCLKKKTKAPIPA